MSSKAGSKVRIVNIDTTIPIAPIGPKPAVLVSWLKRRTKSEMATVEPDARIGSQTPL